MKNQSEFFSAFVQTIDLQAVNMMRRWLGMWERCYDPESQAYQWYGARGIQVCSEWFEFTKFLTFFECPPFEKATIGRIDNDGHYEPSNCEWQTQEQQNNNTRRSKLIEYNGKTQSIRDWAQEYNIGSRRLSERLRRGWDTKRALETLCPLNFDAELKNRRIANEKSWSTRGHLYAARSKYRRGDRLSLCTQDLLAVEGVEPTAKMQVQKAKIKRSSYSAVTDERRQQVLTLRQAGLTVRKIADWVKMPKSTVHFIIASQSELC